MSWFDDAKEVDTLTIEGGDGMERLCEEKGCEVEVEVEWKSVRSRWWAKAAAAVDEDRHRHTKQRRAAIPNARTLASWSSSERRTTIHPNPGPVDLRRRSPILALPNASARRPDTTRQDFLPLALTISPNTLQDGFSISCE